MVQNSQGEPQESFVRWAGSKRKILKFISRYWDSSYNKYVEPFMGSASLFFCIRPQRAILGDINSELIDTFRAVQQHPEKVFDSLRPRPVRSKYYYALRAQDPCDLSEVSRAARFIYLNRFCFNGLYRTNLGGRFNVPYSGSKTGRKPTKGQLEGCARLLKHASLYRMDFEELVSKYVHRGDFVYLDPPYATCARRIFREYGPAAFQMADLKRLHRVLKDIASRGAIFVLSYAYCPEVLTLVQGWSCKRIFVQRNMAGFAASRRVAAEILVTNASLQ